MTREVDGMADKTPSDEVVLRNLVVAMMRRLGLTWADVGDVRDPDPFEGLPDADGTARRLRRMYEEVEPDVSTWRRDALLASTGQGRDGET